ncbi:MAG: glycosyl hydrolase, partial [Gammaproteobacteria bacterium]|nr:glycosyl hydrolase [Gammaproteobacteria bacterium]
LYYMGATGGGVWKTENAGTTWENISDNDFNVGTIGAIAVAQSDHNVLYVGTGESPIRGVTTSHGDGVYKSTDAGKTWHHVGLKKAGQISRIKIHPKNPNIAFVAVQGDIWGPSEQRGIFRTTDGGKTWVHVLKIGRSTGASDLTMDATNPRILYAAMWNHGRKPWFIHSGGKDGGIYKTTDGGDNWTKLEEGLPSLVGKIGVDVSASNPQKVYAIIEAEPGKGGLYRSDDAGESWSQINGHRSLHTRAWYYNHIRVDPTDEDTVWVMNVPMMKSVNGGKDWERTSLPHSDTHDHWINPDNNKNMINANDGGASITFDGGKTWSSISNQPTAQFYRVSTDNQYPYRIYGGQQDNTTVAIASQSFTGGIGVDDYYDVGGGESAHIAFDPDNPRLIYATTINGTLTEYDRDTKITRTIIPYPELVYGMDSRDLKYRANWNPPVILSPHDPSVIYYGTQLLLKSTDRGITWSEISPDLTRNNYDYQGRNGGPLTPENVGAEFYNTIFYIAESKSERGTIWVGSDDGLLHVTMDDGKNWSNVSPKHRSEAMINSIELSPHDRATAYVAVTGYKLNDFHPYIYKTKNYGKSWKRIDKGLPKDTFVRVVREDPTKQGLLYAGTETGMFVSYNDGKDWQSLKLNLPPVPITDLSIRHNNLIAATQGRGFWVLDDLFTIRQASADIDNKPLHAYTPNTTYMSLWNSSAADFEGKNPATGVQLYYYLSEESDAPLTIDIKDNKGKIIRHYSSEKSDHDECRISNMDPAYPFTISYPKKKKGLNLWSWNLNSENLECIPDITLFAGFSGPKVLPGLYSATFSIGKQQETINFKVEPDPRVKVSEYELIDWDNHQKEVSSLITEILSQLQAIRGSKTQAQALQSQFSDNQQLKTMVDTAAEKITQWEAMIIQMKHQTYEDEDAWRSMLVSQLRYLLDVISYTGAPVTNGAKTRMADLKTTWAQLQKQLSLIKEQQLIPINNWAKKNNINHIQLPE